MRHAIFALALLTTACLGFGAGYVAGVAGATPPDEASVVVASYASEDEGSAVVYGWYGGLIDGWSYRFAYMPPDSRVWYAYYYAHEAPSLWRRVRIKHENGVLTVHREGNRIGRYDPGETVFDNLLQERQRRYTEPLSRSRGVPSR